MSRARESERWRKGSFGTSRKPSDDESNAVDRPPGARKTEVEQTRKRHRRGADSRSRLESEREGCFRAGRYSRKSRKRVEWRENSCGWGYIVARGEFKRRKPWGSVEGSFCSFRLPTFASLFTRSSCAAPRSSMLFVSLEGLARVFPFLVRRRCRRQRRLSWAVLFVSTVRGGD